MAASAAAKAAEGPIFFFFFGCDYGWVKQHRLEPGGPIAGPRCEDEDEGARRLLRERWQGNCQDTARWLRYHMDQHHFRVSTTVSRKCKTSGAGFWWASLPIFFHFTYSLSPQDYSFPNNLCFRIEKLFPKSFG